MEIHALRGLGLTNAEAIIYSTLLELGPSKTGMLIDKTNLQSSTVYHALGSLIEKGIVSFIHEGKIKIYNAESPNILLEIHDKKKKEFLEILPKLREKQTFSKSKQTAKIYKGIKGLQTAFGEILISMKKGEEYYFFQVHREELEEDNFLTFFRNYHLKRSKKGIKIKGLAMKKAKEKTKEIFKKLKHTQIKYVEEFLPTGLAIYKNKIIITEWEESPISIVIESKAIANSYKQFFLDKFKNTK
jgi:HTH-type transcriptional regulator, sugar sensing transcriptional regulator